MRTDSFLISIPLQFGLPCSQREAAGNDFGAGHPQERKEPTPLMELPMFKYSFVPVGPGRRPLMAVYASVFEIALVAILILAPLIFNPVLPQRVLLNAVMLAPVPFAPPAPSPPVLAKRIPRATPVRQFNPE